uniref:Uncharacterized protein n=1 Tax=Anguilla anguilla TaxID=7936 RepID=A0A0E9W0E2_ANGAN
MYTNTHCTTTMIKRESIYLKIRLITKVDTLCSQDLCR